MTLDQIDRRLFLRGLMLTSAGLVVPKPVMGVVPKAIAEEMPNTTVVESAREFLVYTRVLTDAEIVRLSSYLNRVWGSEPRFGFTYRDYSGVDPIREWGCYET